MASRGRSIPIVQILATSTRFLLGWGVLPSPPAVYATPRIVATRLVTTLSQDLPNTARCADNRLTLLPQVIDTQAIPGHPRKR
jgi:hypothetical protein